jgi:uncharacterized repeat protein (TIGR03943 family)
MSRETQNALLLLIGVSTGLITLSGAFTRYVKPSLLPWLALSAVALIVLALVSIARDIRRGTGISGHGDHVHHSGVLWLLLVPVALLAFVVPPAIGAGASSTAVREQSTGAVRHPFPPLPAQRAPELSLPELLMRVAQDSSGSLDNRLVSVTGFVTRDGDRLYLDRVVIICCAADAQLARLQLRGAATTAAKTGDGTWVRVEGKILPGQSDSPRGTTPVMDVTQMQRIAPPANTYAY